MPPLPRDRWPDSTMAFLWHGYGFVADRCERFGSDVFAARLGLQPVICMRGAEAAELFYSGRFRRTGAAPAPLRRTVFGEGGVQGLDDVPHHHRKQMLMSLMTPEAVDDLARRLADAWTSAIGRWEQRDEVVLYDEVARLLCEVACGWAGVPLPGDDLDRRALDLRALFDPITGPAVPYVGARRARGRAEAWIAGLVDRTRRGQLAVRDGTALEVIATHRDVGGRPLDARVAAVEVLNVLRPTVAVSLYVVLAALELHRHPAWRDRLRTGSEEEGWRFVQEVRRLHPLLPVIPARVREGFVWNGVHFPGGHLVLLDVYATNRHPGRWDDPHRFDPGRFAAWDGSPFALIPQGGGAHEVGHRCAGEWATIRLMQTAVTLLTRGMTYRVPPQDLRVSPARMPRRPASGLVLRDVHAAAQSA